MNTVSYTSDIIRGSNNFGESVQMTDVSNFELEKMINELNSKFGSPQEICGMKLWSNSEGDTFTISVINMETKWKLKI